MNQKIPNSYLSTNTINSEIDDDQIGMSHL